MWMEWVGGWIGRSIDESMNECMDKHKDQLWVDRPMDGWIR